MNGPRVIEYHVRLDDGLRRALAAAARNAERSLHKEVIWRLRQSLALEQRDAVSA
jgi:hypothetical protein